MVFLPLILGSTDEQCIGRGMVVKKKNKFFTKSGDSSSDNADDPRAKPVERVAIAHFQLCGDWKRLTC